MALHTGVRRHRFGERIACFDPRTGQHGWFTAGLVEQLDVGDEIPPPVLARLRRLGLWEGPLETSGLVPSWHRRTLWLPRRQLVWHPVAEVRTAGGWAYAGLSTTEGALLEAIDGRRTLGELARQLNRTPEALFAALQPLTAVQAVLLRHRAAQRRDPALEQLFAPPRPPNARTEAMGDGQGGTALSQWHQESIHDGATHFDDRETTIAHALGLPHPGLGGRTFGAALAEGLRERGALDEQTAVVEVGCGTGELAAAATDSVPHRAWVRVDLSPALLAHQSLTAPGTHGVLADATALPLATGSVTLLLSNEVLADLPAVIEQHEDDAVGRRRRRYGLAPLPPNTRTNLGALQLVEEVARVLAPGGCAYLSEFGAEHEVPTETEQLDHPEVSIHFGHLCTAARALGLHAELWPMADFLGLDRSAEQLSRASYEALRALAHADDRPLRARAWTRDNLPWTEPISGLHWVTLAEEGPGPLVDRFCVLWLTRPGRRG